MNAMNMKWKDSTRLMMVDGKPTVTLDVHTTTIERDERYIISIEEHYDITEPPRSKYDVILRSDDGTELARMRMVGPVEDLKKLAMPTVLMGLRARREYMDAVIDDVCKIYEEMYHE